VLENGEDGVQIWHLDGHSVFVVGYAIEYFPEIRRELVLEPATPGSCSVNFWLPILVEWTWGRGASRAGMATTLWTQYRDAPCK
jgi:hypothetical protein